MGMNGTNTQLQPTKITHTINHLTPLNTMNTIHLLLLINTHYSLSHPTRPTHSNHTNSTSCDTSHCASPACRAIHPHSCSAPYSTRTSTYSHGSDNLAHYGTSSPTPTTRQCTTSNNHPPTCSSDHCNHPPTRTDGPPTTSTLHRITPTTPPNHPHHNHPVGSECSNTPQHSTCNHHAPRFLDWNQIHPRNSDIYSLSLIPHSFPNKYSHTPDVNSSRSRFNKRHIDNTQ